MQIWLSSSVSKHLFLRGHLCSCKNRILQTAKEICATRKRILCARKVMSGAVPRHFPISTALGMARRRLSSRPAHVRVPERTPRCTVVTQMRTQPLANSCSIDDVAVGPDPLDHSSALHTALQVRHGLLGARLLKTSEPSIRGYSFLGPRSPPWTYTCPACRRAVQTPPK